MSFGIYMRSNLYILVRCFLYHPQTLHNIRCKTNKTDIHSLLILLEELKLFSHQKFTIEFNFREYCIYCLKITQHQRRFKITMFQRDDLNYPGFTNLFSGVRNNKSSSGQSQLATTVHFLTNVFFSKGHIMYILYMPEAFHCPEQLPNLYSHPIDMSLRILISISVGFYTARKYLIVQIHTCTFDQD